jgi:hypothetical protein
VLTAALVRGGGGGGRLVSRIQPAAPDLSMIFSCPSVASLLRHSGAHRTGCLLFALAVWLISQLAIADPPRPGVGVPFDTPRWQGVGLDWLVWRRCQRPTWPGAVIVGSGLYLVRREQRISEVHANAEHP